MVSYANEISNKMDPCRRPGFFHQVHIHMIQHSVALLIIAFLASANHILPAVFSATISGNNMIYGKGATCCTTILALVAIPFQDILPG